MSFQSGDQKSKSGLSAGSCSLQRFYRDSAFWLLQLMVMRHSLACGCLCLSLSALLSHLCLRFELWCWRRLFRVPWTVRRSNQSILKEISPEFSLEGLMLKLKLQYFGHLMQRTDSLEETWCWERLEVGGEGDDRGWDGWMASLTQWTWVWVNSGRWWWTGMPGMLQSMGSQRVTELHWTELNLIYWVSFKTLI